MGTVKELDTVAHESRGESERPYEIRTEETIGSRFYGAAALLVGAIIGLWKNVAFAEGPPSAIVGAGGVAASSHSAVRSAGEPAAKAPSFDTDGASPDQASRAGPDGPTATRSPAQETAGPQEYAVRPLRSSGLLQSNPEYNPEAVANDNGDPSELLTARGKAGPLPASSDQAAAPPDGSDAAHDRGSHDDPSQSETDPTTAPKNTRNRAPTVSGPVALGNMAVNASLVIGLTHLLEHATDADGDVLSIAHLEASSGNLTDNGDGTWTFTSGNETGAVTFCYVVTDGEGSVSQTAVLELDAAPAGVDGADVVHGTSGADVLASRGTAGHAVVAASTETSSVATLDHSLQGNPEIINGTSGNDTIAATDGSDTIYAGAGDDLVFAGGGDDIIAGEQGSDVVYGGAGNDTMIATIGDGNDTYDGGDGSDTYDLSAVTADVVVDLIAGTCQSGETGSDTLVDIENVIGGAGNDTIYASRERNVLSGGDGNDLFVYRSCDDSPADEDSYDTIVDFERGDRIDFSQFKRNAQPGDDVDNDNTTGALFKFLGNSDNFTEAGELRYRIEHRDDGDHTIIFGNIDDDLVEDFIIDLLGQRELDSGDFVGVYVSGDNSYIIVDDKSVAKSIEAALDALVSSDCADGEDSNASATQGFLKDLANAEIVSSSKLASIVAEGSSVDVANGNIGIVDDSFLYSGASAETPEKWKPGEVIVVGDRVDAPTMGLSDELDDGPQQLIIEPPTENGPEIPPPCEETTDDGPGNAPTSIVIVAQPPIYVDETQNNYASPITNVLGVA